MGAVLPDLDICIIPLGSVCDEGMEKSGCNDGIAVLT